MDDDHKTIVVERPTGPRLTAAEPRPLGQFVTERVHRTSKSIVSVAEFCASAAAASLKKHKFLSAISGSAVLAVVAHLLVSAVIGNATIAVTMMGIIDNNRTSAASFTGPGDLGLSGGYSFHSCARAWSASFAAGGTAICDLVDTATGAASCTLKIGSNGFADLSSNVCVGNTVSVTTFCTVTHAGCSVTKRYDQTGAGRDATNATLAQMPLLTLNALNSLPGTTCASTGTVCFLATGSLTTSQPLNLSLVYNVNGSGTSSQGYFGAASNGPCLGKSITADQGIIFGNTGSVLKGSVTDGSWHSLNGLANGTNPNSVINADGGTDTTGTLGTNGLVAVAIRIHRAGAQDVTTIMESIIWQGSAFSQSDRQTIYANQHGSNGYGSF